MSKTTGSFLLILFATLLAPRGARKAATVTAGTDQAGRFRITVPTPGMWTVLVEAPGRLAWEYSLPLLESTDLPTVSLKKSRNVALRVVGGDGQPIAGALATTSEASRWDQQMSSTGDWWPAAQLGRSDKEGHLVVPRIVTKRVELLVWAPGFLTTDEGRGLPAPDRSRAAPQAGGQRHWRGVFPPPTSRGSSTCAASSPASGACERARRAMTRPTVWSRWRPGITPGD